MLSDDAIRAMAEEAVEPIVLGYWRGWMNFAGRERAAEVDRIAAIITRHLHAAGGDERLKEAAELSTWRGARITTLEAALERIISNWSYRAAGCEHECSVIAQTALDGKLRQANSESEVTT